MLKALFIGNMKDEIDVIFNQIDLFVPKITNWSLCDSFCNELKIVRKHKDKGWKFLQQYISSDKPYEIRFAVVMLLFHFIEEKYLMV